MRSGPTVADRPPAPPRWLAARTRIRMAAAAAALLVFSVGTGWLTALTWKWMYAPQFSDAANHSYSMLAGFGVLAWFVLCAAVTVIAVGLAAALIGRRDCYARRCERATRLYVIDRTYRPFAEEIELLGVSRYATSVERYGAGVVIRLVRERRNGRRRSVEIVEQRGEFYGTDVESAALAVEELRALAREREGTELAAFRRAKKDSRVWRLNANSLPCSPRRPPESRLRRPRLPSALKLAPGATTSIAGASRASRLTDSLARFAQAADHQKARRPGEAGQVHIAGDRRRRGRPRNEDVRAKPEDADGPTLCFLLRDVERHYLADARRDVPFALAGPTHPRASRHRPIGLRRAGHVGRRRERRPGEQHRERHCRRPGRTARSAPIRPACRSAIAHHRTERGHLTGARSH